VSAELLADVEDGIAAFDAVRPATDYDHGYLAALQDLLLKHHARAPGAGQAQPGSEAHDA